MILLTEIFLKYFIAKYNWNDMQFYRFYLKLPLFYNYGNERSKAVPWTIERRMNSGYRTHSDPFSVHRLRCRRVQFNIRVIVILYGNDFLCIC